MFRDRDQRKPQFVCATQPLASFLSKDSVLCFDGDAYGLYYPWRGEAKSAVRVNPNLDKYLESENAFALPSIAEQKRLVGLFFDHLYPFYPVVDRSMRDDFKDQPLILLNSIFLAATRFDKSIPREYLRERLAVLYNRCKLLELVETNKVVLIQAYVLLSSHEEGMEGDTSSKEFVAKACNLCGELAITNMGHSEEAVRFPFPKGDQTFQRALVKRLLWTTFCCDRQVSATSGREMIFNVHDFFVERLSINDFEEGPEGEKDFTLFNAWFELCLLIDRIQSALYRPPPNRSDDSELQKDLEDWTAPDIPNDPEKTCFLKVTHAYLCLLYLRKGIDSVALSLHNTALNIAFDKELETTIDQMHRTSSLVLDILDKSPILHHIVMVHAVLHVVALLQLELNTHHGTESEKTSFKDYYDQMIKRCLERLQSFKDYWWFAGSALKLCQVITE
ncbi:hypothetical protein FT663_00779 [Candidozyma haemuli var. vulneris]|uniref:Xylanolytic transcriptional activator regulatory domain-containing protein n=1 Tax=Candidozyma haemuli TaxID=45357 RepID=A0A2V1AZE9_9ASCO|nr:hypothetical protein CXQ85_005288 [[Candida] haemuloni]KAF3992869.1 hypothetical protein FT662_00871 [[Candida] haemuloni var. vulneris]KAF3995080.1 hypothetical protein FT663_00779 [[Candida] haemuloni var. vulneris]PVH22261.1 hypothetical protein CXQ85_005288 [[Candida] haemuloni]